MGFEILLKGNNMIRLLQGVWVALRISLISVVLSMAFGILLGMIMTSKNRIIQAVTRVYLEIVRIMPQLVLLFIVYFGATKAMGINMDAETASIIVFVFWGTAEMADLVRGSLLSVPKIQYESSEALGLDQRQTYQYVIIPQIIRRMIPLSINLITRMIKTTSLVMMIGIVEVLKVGQQIIEANRKTAPMDEILHIKNLSKCYGDTKVLKNINISVKKGEVVVIIGPSGCGKSTLLRCLNGLEEIQEGEVLLDDQVVNPNKKNLSKNREKIGMVFQSYDLFPHLTILQNVTLAPIKVKKRNRREVEKEALELLERVGLRSKKDDYPRQLSGGQKQRVAIVRALIMHPEVLLLDEITAALDPEMVREVLDVVLDLAKEGRTMVIVTHEMQFAKAVADRVTFLEGGKIVEEGDPKKLFEKPETDRLQRFLQTFTYEKAVK